MSSHPFSDDVDTEELRTGLVQSAVAVARARGEDTEDIDAVRRDNPAQRAAVIHKASLAVASDNLAVTRAALHETLACLYRLQTTTRCMTAKHKYETAVASAQHRLDLDMGSCALATAKFEIAEKDLALDELRAELQGRIDAGEATQDALIAEVAWLKAQLAQKEAASVARGSRL